MEKHDIAQTGKDRLTFMGEEIFKADTKTTEGPTRTRWHVVRVFITNKGHYIVGIAHKTTWDGENNTYSAFSQLNPWEAIDLVTKVNPEWEPEIIDAVKANDQ